MNVIPLTLAVARGATDDINRKIDALNEAIRQAAEWGLRVDMRIQEWAFIAQADPVPQLVAQVTVDPNKVGHDEPTP